MKKKSILITVLVLLILAGIIGLRVLSPTE